MKLTTRAVAAATALLLLPAAASAQTGTGENITPVKNLAFSNTLAATEKNAGTDIEFAEIGGVQYAFAGSYGDGIQIFDISDPENTTRVATWECGMSQADVQVFQRPDLDGRWFMTSTHDDGYTFRGGACKTELAAKGRPVTNSGEGTFIAEITDPLNPKTVSFVPVDKTSADGLSEGASHNATVHPSGKFIYNSNSDLMTSVATRMPEIEVISIEDIENPKSVGGVELKIFPGLGTESHDVTFSADGKRAYSAALSHAAILDTTDPAKPKNIGTVVDPAINVFHQADPVTITDKTTGMKRDFLVIEDEVAGALETGQCPNGGVHVYDMTGPLEANPVKVGYWNIDEVRTAQGSFLGLGGCTAHVFRLHGPEALMTIAYYNGGVRVVDISGLVGVALGKAGVGMKQLGFYRFSNSNTWAVKAPFVSRDGFYLYGNDQNRALDVYKYEPKTPTLTETSDTWMTPGEQLLAARNHEKRFGKPRLAALCLLNAKSGAELTAATRSAGLRAPFQKLALGS